MATFYFKAPLTGSISSDNTYCCDEEDEPCPHCVCEASCTASNANAVNPKDITGNENQALVAYGKAGGSIKVETLSAGCCSTCSTAQYKNARFVSFYKNTGGSGFMGKVLFAHVKEPKANDTYDEDSIVVGKVPGGSCGSPACYGGPHSHIERRGGAAVGVECSDDVTTGSDNIYEFTYT
jgi:hypothetical protein